MNKQTERQAYCPECKTQTRHIQYRQWGRRHDVCTNYRGVGQGYCTHCLVHGDGDAVMGKHFNSAAGRRERQAQWEAEAAARAARMALPVWER